MSAIRVADSNFIALVFTFARLRAHIVLAFID